MQARLFAGIAIKFRTRAYLFAQALFDPKLQLKTFNFDDGTRLRKGVPDHPFSLMEGYSGVVCFLSDLLRNEAEMRLPGFEI